MAAFDLSQAFREKAAPKNSLLLFRYLLAKYKKGAADLIFLST